MERFEANMIKGSMTSLLPCFSVLAKAESQPLLLRFSRWEGSWDFPDNVLGILLRDFNCFLLNWLLNMCESMCISEKIENCRSGEKGLADPIVDYLKACLILLSYSSLLSDSTDPAFPLTLKKKKLKLKSHIVKPCN